MINWIKVKDQLPKEGQLVDTKIDDCKSIRNEQPLKRFKNLPPRLGRKKNKEKLKKRKIKLKN